MTDQSVPPASAPGGLRRGLRERLSGEMRTADEVRDAVYLFTGDSAGKQSRFWLLLALSTAIATAGIVGNATATVIGAMIVAPLATPIQGVAVAIAYGELRALLASLSILGLAIIVVIGLSLVLAVVLPNLEPLSDNVQVTSRVSPTLVDLAAAAATGLAGAFAVARRDIGDILPGVAIAISLVPPLCVVGVTIGAGDWDYARGAMLLFATNVLAMILVGVLLHRGLAEIGGKRLEASFKARPVYALLGISTLVVTGSLSAATYHAVQLSDWLQTSKEIASQWASDNGQRVVTTNFDGGTLVVLVEGRGTLAEDRQLLTLLHGKLPSGTPVDVNRVAGQRRTVGTVP